jgi:PIN domain nuclease of toxin-antitoxin system
MLVMHGRLRLQRDIGDWVDMALCRPKVELCAFSPAAAVRAAGLGREFPGDPADRFIVAMALELGAPLLTNDHRITAWGGIDAIW